MFKNKILKETFWSFLSKGISLILFLALNIYLARTLSVNDYGLWSFFLSMLTILSTLSYFGINNSSKKFIAEFNETHFLSTILKISFKLRVLVSFLFSVFIMVFSFLFSNVIGKSDFFFLFFCAGPIIFFAGLVEYLKAVFTGLHRIKFVFFITLIEFSLKLILVVLLFYYSPTLLSIIISFNFSLLVASLLGIYFLYNFYSTSIGEEEYNFKQKILEYSYPFVFISIGFIALTELDTIMIGLISTNEQVAIYSVAKQIVSKLPQISFAVALGIMPIFAKLTLKNSEVLKRKFYRILTINAGIFALLSVSFILFAKNIIDIVFGPNYQESILPMQLLSIYMFLYANSIILSEFLDYTGKAKKRAKNIVLVIVLNIVLGLILIPKYGATGAALAVCLSYIPYIVLNIFEIRKVFSSFSQ